MAVQARIFIPTILMECRRMCCKSISWIMDSKFPHRSQDLITCHSGRQPETISDKRTTDKLQVQHMPIHLSSCLRFNNIFTSQRNVQRPGNFYCGESFSLLYPSFHRIINPDDVGRPRIVVQTLFSREEGV